MPASKNILGPDPARGGTVTRPAKTTVPNATPHWFNTCNDPNDPNQTKITTDFLNDVSGVLRESIATSGANQQEAAASSDKMIGEAMARYASGGCFGVCSGSANTYTVTSSGLFIVPTSFFDGMVVDTEPSATNTGASTAAVFGLAVKDVRTYDDKALTGGELVIGVPVTLRYKSAANAGAGAWLIVPMGLSYLDRLPFYPEIDASGNVFAFTTSTGQIIINASQQWRHRGHRILNTSDYSAPSRTFATAASKTYHLRWTWANGAGSFSLVDMTSASPVETDPSYDSTFDSMLIARVVTSAGNVLTVTALVNKDRLYMSVLNQAAVTSPYTDSANKSSQTVTANWARVPRFYTIEQYDILVAPDAGGGSFAGSDIHDHDERWRVDTLTRYSALVNIRRDFAYVLDFKFHAAA